VSWGRGLVAALALGACHHNGGPTKLDVDEPDLPHPAPTVIDAGAVTPPGPSGPADAWKVPPAVVPLAGAGPRAFVADRHGLVEVATGAAPASQVVTDGTIAWCNVDARGQVVWFARGADLFAFDLVDRSVHRVVHNVFSDGGVGTTAMTVIDWGNQRLGGESAVDFNVAPSLVMTGTPKVAAAIGCEGDDAWYCYDDPGAEKPTLKPELAGEVAAINALTVDDPAYLGKVATRGATGSLWTPPPMPPVPPRKRPKVDPSACETPADCGGLTAIPGNTVYVVVSGSSRGDFYSESHVLWDSVSGDFLGLGNGTIVRSRQVPTSTGELGGLRASPSGGLTFGGVVFDAARVYYATQLDEQHDAMSCGWTDGGWRIRGPRDS
jgi:hypothetical protein